MELKQRLDKQSLTFTAVLCVTYCFIMVVMHSVFLASYELWTGSSEPILDCFASSTSLQTVDAKSDDAVNVSSRFWDILVYGLVVHIIGFFSDAIFAFRIWSECWYFRAYSLAFTSVYAILWTVWIVMVHVIRYSNTGTVCSSPVSWSDGYTVIQGQVLTEVIVALWVINGAVGVLAVMQGGVVLVVLKVKSKKSKKKVMQTVVTEVALVTEQQEANVDIESLDKASTFK